MKTKRADIIEGPIFRPINRGRRVVNAKLTAESAAQVVKDAAERAGLDPVAFAGHSLRAGFLTSAAGAAASIFKMMESIRICGVPALLLPRSDFSDRVILQITGSRAGCKNRHPHIS